MPVEHPRVISLMALMLSWPAFGMGQDLPDFVSRDQLPIRLSAQISPRCSGAFVNSFDQRQAQVPQGPAELYIDSQSLNFLLNQRMTATGEVRIAYQDNYLLSEQASYDLANQVLTLEQDFSLWQPELFVKGRQGSLDQSADRIELAENAFILYQQQMHGQSQAFVRSGDGSLQLKNMRISRCTPDQNHWSLSGSQVNIDPNKGRAQLYNGVLRLGPVPVLWVPYASFPTDDRRKTGLLAPSFNLNSQGELTRLRLPLYLNLAANYDSTLTLDWYPQLGLVWDNQARYLNRRGQASLYTGILSHDQQPLLDAEQEPVQRWGLHLQAQQRLNPQWHWQANVRHASDERWFLDFGSASGIQRTQSQWSRLNWQQQQWRGFLLFERQAIVALEPKLSDRKYRLWPRVGLSWQQQQQGWQYGFNNELTWFSKENPETLRDQIDPDLGHQLASLRHQIRLHSRYLYRPTWGQTDLQLQVFSNQYQLFDQGLSDERPEQSAWAVPVLNLDQRLYFDRDWPWDGRFYRHSLIPRANLSYVPLVESQLDSPVFDSALSSSLDNNYFQPLRFSGKDRYGDSLRLGLELGNEWMALQQGRRLLDVRLSQGFLLRQQRLGLNSLADIDPDWQVQPQDIHLRNNWWPVPGWQFNANFRWQYQAPDEGNPWLAADYPLMERQLGARWRAEQGSLFNASWSRLGDGRPFEDSVDSSVVLAVTPSLGLYGGLKLDNKTEQDWRLRQSVYGIEIDNCCWHVRLLRFDRPLYEDEPEVVRSLTDMGDGFRIEFELKGLIGRQDGADELLNSLPGYRGRLFQYR